jgi:hypothetical protein
MFRHLIWIRRAAVRDKGKEDGAVEPIRRRREARRATDHYQRLSIGPHVLFSPQTQRWCLTIPSHRIAPPFHMLLMYPDNLM